MAILLKSEAEKFLGDVPEAFMFHCNDGRVFRNMRELSEGLLAMTDESFAFHANKEKNDFSRWVQDIIKDEKLASDLLKNQTRQQAAKTVAARISLLSSKLKK